MLVQLTEGQLKPEVILEQMNSVVMQYSKSAMKGESSQASKVPAGQELQTVSQSEILSWNMSIYDSCNRLMKADKYTVISNILCILYTDTLTNTILK